MNTHKYQFFLNILDTLKKNGDFISPAYTFKMTFADEQQIESVFGEGEHSQLDYYLEALNEY